MRCRIAVAHHPVLRARHDVDTAQHDRADRDFPGQRGLSRFVQRERHRGIHLGRHGRAGGWADLVTQPRIPDGGADDANAA